MNIKKKFESIDQSQLSESQKGILAKIEEATKGFTITDEKSIEKVDTALDNIISKLEKTNPQAIKGEVKEVKPKREVTKKPAKSTTKTPKEPKKEAKGKRTIFSIAKEIRKADESWDEAKNRAKKIMEDEKKDTTKKMKTETDKLLAFIKRRKELDGLSGTSVKKDSKIEALPKGRRVSKKGWKNQHGESEGGKVYYENRDNRTDRLAPNFEDKIYLAEGGGVERINEGDKVTYKGNSYMVSKIVTKNIRGLYDVQYHLHPLKRNVESVVVDNSRFIKKLADGGTIIGTPETPLGRDLGINYTGLVGETGAMSSGEMFAGGGATKNFEYVPYQFIYRELDDPNFTPEIYSPEAVKEFIEDFNNDMETEYENWEDFNKGEENRNFQPMMIKQRKFADGGQIEYEIEYKDSDGDEYSESFKTLEEANGEISRLQKAGFKITDKMKHKVVDGYGTFIGRFADGGGVDKWIGYDKDHLMNMKNGMIVLRGTDLKDIKPKDIKGFDMLDNRGYADGGTIIGTPETPLGRDLGIDYTGLVGETGAMSSGEMFMAGGSTDREDFYSKNPRIPRRIEITKKQYLSKKSSIKNNKWHRNLVDPMGYEDDKGVYWVEFDIEADEKSSWDMYSWITKNIPSSEIKIFVQDKNFNKYEQGGSLVDGYLTDPNFGDFQAGVYADGGGVEKNFDLSKYYKYATWKHLSLKDAKNRVDRYREIFGDDKKTKLVLIKKNERTYELWTNIKFEETGERVYEMGGNTGLPAGAEQSYVNYYLNEGATAGMYKKGGAIPNNYEGRTPDDVWDNLTLKQRTHFLLDHYNNPKLYSSYRPFLKNEYKNLPIQLKDEFKFHVREGQYAYGGKAKSIPSMRELHIEQIASLTGTRSVGIQKFADDNNLTDSELSNLMTGVGRGMIKRSDFVTALAGEKNNPIQKEVVAFAKSDKAYKMAKGGGVRKDGNREYPMGRAWTNEHRHTDKADSREVNYKRKRSFADGGSVESKVDELYEKSTFINDDYNWKSKLLEMLQDNSIEAYNIYQSLNDTQKEEVLQELYEMDNDFGSEGDGDIETSKENLSYLLDDAKNGKKYATGGVIGKEMTFNRHGEEAKGIIGEVNEDGSYNVATKYSSILVEPQDVIAINDAPKKKRFFFDEGGKLPDTIDGYDIDFSKWRGDIIASIEVEPNSAPFEPFYMKGIGKTEKEAFENLEKKYNSMKISSYVVTFSIDDSGWIKSNPISAYTEEQASNILYEDASDEGDVSILKIDKISMADGGNVIDAFQMRTVRGVDTKPTEILTTDQKVEFAGGGSIKKEDVKVGDILMSKTGVKVKVVEFDPKFGGRLRGIRLDEFGTNKPSIFIPLKMFTHKVEFAKGGSIKNEDIKVGEEFWLANGDVIEIVRLFKENIDEDWVEYKRNGEKKENSVKELRLFINRLSGKKQKSWRERRNEYLEKLGQKEADVWDKIGAESGSEIRNSDKMLKAYAEGVQEMLQKEEVGKGSFDQEDYDFYTDLNWHLFNDFLVWNNYYDPEMTKNEKAWREKMYKEDMREKGKSTYTSNPSIISISGGSKSKSDKYIAKADIKEVWVKMDDGTRFTFKGSDVLNGVNVLEKGSLLKNNAKYIAKRNIMYVVLKNGEEVKPANGYWIKKDAKGELFKPENKAGKTGKLSFDDWMKKNNIEVYKRTYYWVADDGKGDYLYSGTKAEVMKSLREDYKKSYDDGGLLGNKEPREEDLITNIGKYGSRITKVTDSYVEFYDNKSMKMVSCKKSDLVLNNIDDDGDDDGFYEDEPNSWICKKSYEGGGKTTFKQKATAIAKNFKGKKVEPKYQKEYGKTYDKAEAKEVGNKIAGSMKAKYETKMKKGGGIKKTGGAMVLAKQIRKEGESWQNALKRANAQVRNK